MTTARERALLASFVFLLLLGAVAALASWRARSDINQHRSLEGGTAVLAALDDARAQLLLGAIWVASSAIAEDPVPFHDLNRQAEQALRKRLAQARLELIALGATDELATVDQLASQVDELARELDLLWEVSLTADADTRTEVTRDDLQRLWPLATQTIAGMEQVVSTQRSRLAAERSAADRSAEITYWLLVGTSSLALLVGVAALLWLVASISRPLASLQASVAAIRSGNLDTKAKVSGPEEVASLARDFNEMIAARRLAEETLRESAERYRELFDNANDILYTHDLAGRFTSLNKAGEGVTGYTRAEAIGMSIANVVAPEHLSRARDMTRQKVAGARPTTYELDIIAKDGRRIPLEVSTRLVQKGGKPVAVQGIARDITERKREEEELRERVRRDPLTGALNHAAIVQELGDLISPARDGASYAVAMIDVDGLKATNDTYGHQAGDAVLVAVARALSRDGALVGRYGGDEFVAILPGADGDATEHYREEVLAELADIDLRDTDTGARVPVAISVGFAFYPGEAARLEELIKLADSAMYAAKRQRPVGPAGKAPPRPLGGDRAAKMVGEIVPLLTSPGDLNDKLRLVSHRLSVGAGYDAVYLDVFGASPEKPLARNAFAPVPDDAVAEWLRDKPAEMFGPVLQRTRRPLILDDPQHDPRLAESERELVRRAGVRSVLIAPLIWQDEIIGRLSVARKRGGSFGPQDTEFLMAVATQVTAIARMGTLVEELRSASDRLTEGHIGTVMLLAAAAEAHDRTTGKHLQNVRAITEALAQELGHSEDWAREVGLAAVLHDIGKIRVPDVILAGSGRLSDEEWELLKQHTVWGEEFLSRRPGFELAAVIARSHHERWDGGGYPDGLSGDAIPEAAAIVAVADAFDAMTSHRPYRAGRPIAAAVREVTECADEQFSARVVQALISLHNRGILPPTVGESPDQKAAA